MKKARSPSSTPSRSAATPAPPSASPSTSPTPATITRAEALLRIEPRSLIEHLHPQIDPAAARDVFATGLAASPGAATGRLVFTAEAAQAAAAQDEATILVRARDQPRGHPRHARRRAAS